MLTQPRAASGAPNGTSRSAYGQAEEEDDDDGCGGAIDPLARMKEEEEGEAYPSRGYYTAPSVTLSERSPSGQLLRGPCAEIFAHATWNPIPGDRFRLAETCLTASTT